MYYILTALATIWVCGFLIAFLGNCVDDERETFKEHIIQFFMILLWPLSATILIIHSLLKK